MNNLSIVVLDGNLVADPEIKSVKGDKSVANFSIAVNHEFASKEGNHHVSYFHIECWDKLAASCGQFLKKGSRITIRGELRQDRWKDESGKTQSRVKIVAQAVRFDSKQKKHEEEAA